MYVLLSSMKFCQLTVAEAAFLTRATWHVPKSDKATKAMYESPDGELGLIVVIMRVISRYNLTHAP
jgi:hypothetical protein